MPAKVHLSVPTTAALPHSRRLPSDASDVARILMRLTRSALIDVALQWLDEPNLPSCAPFLDGDIDPDDADIDSIPYVAATSIEELREIYEDFQSRKGARLEVFDRIVESDWRHGISLHQLAIAETRVLTDRPNSLRWNALRLVRVGNSSAVEEVGKGNVPRVSAPTFIANLQREVAPVARAHYMMTRLKMMPVSLLRVYIHDSPYNTQKSLKDASSSAKTQPDGANTLWVAFPDGSPFVYVSLNTNMGLKVGSDARSLKKVVVDAIPKALSRPQCRFALQGTSLHTRSLHLLLSLRGPGRSNSAAGGWSIFAKSTIDQSALQATLPVHSRKRVSEIADDDKENASTAGKRVRITNPRGSRDTRRQSLVAEGRFGASALANDNEGLERLDIRLDEPFPSSPVTPSQDNATGSASLTPSRADALQPPNAAEEASLPAPDGWNPEVRLMFQGAHVFAGIRQLVEQGFIDGEKMAGWMTGEAGVSIGVVRDGRIVTKRNSAV